MLFISNNGRIELEMSLEQAKSISHPGPCDVDVKALSKAFGIRGQLEALNPQTLRQELKEYGAWDETELSDHDQNLQRILWIAACDIAENNR